MVFGTLFALEDGKLADLRRESVEINGLQSSFLVSFSVKQTFKNQFGHKTEIRYVFPKNEDLCVYDASFSINGEKIEMKLGEIVSTRLVKHSIPLEMNEFIIGKLDPDASCELLLNCSLVSSISSDFSISFSVQTERILPNGEKSPLFSGIAGRNSVNIQISNPIPIKSINSNYNGTFTQISSNAASLSIEPIGSADLISVTTTMSEPISSQSTFNGDYAVLAVLSDSDVSFSGPEGLEYALLAQGAKFKAFALKLHEGFRGNIICRAGKEEINIMKTNSSQVRGCEALFSKAMIDELKRKNQRPYDVKSQIIALSLIGGIPSDFTSFGGLSEEREFADEYVIGESEFPTKGEETMPPPQQFGGIYGGQMGTFCGIGPIMEGPPPGDGCTVGGMPPFAMGFDTPFPSQDPDQAGFPGGFSYGGLNPMIGPICGISPPGNGGPRPPWMASQSQPGTEGAHSSEKRGE